MHGRQLLLGGAQIWWTNVIVFALWFWELDGGGPPARLREPKAPRDFAFVQMTDPEVRAGWHPRFADYLYVSFTNASAFSPTDTMPLTLGQAADDARVGDLDADAAARRRARRQHPSSYRTWAAVTQT